MEKKRKGAPSTKAQAAAQEKAREEREAALRAMYVSELQQARTLAAELFGGEASAETVLNTRERLFLNAGEYDPGDDEQARVWIRDALRTCSGIAREWVASTLDPDELADVTFGIFDRCMIGIVDKDAFELLTEDEARAQHDLLQAAYKLAQQAYECERPPIEIVFDAFDQISS